MIACLSIGYQQDTPLNYLCCLLVGQPMGIVDPFHSTLPIVLFPVQLVHHRMHMFVGTEVQVLYLLAFLTRWSFACKISYCILHIAQCERHAQLLLQLIYLLANPGVVDFTQTSFIPILHKLLAKKSTKGWKRKEELGNILYH